MPIAQPVAGSAYSATVLWALLFMPLPQPASSISGVVIASRTSVSSSIAEYHNEGMGVAGMRSQSPPTQVSESYSGVRGTTDREEIIGQLRSWRMLDSDWDGEGAAAPDIRALRGAENFVRVIAPAMPVPEPMLFASGHAGLYWKREGLYADLEFVDERHITYYVEKHAEKHKGLVEFQGDRMPPFFAALLAE